MRKKERIPVVLEHINWEHFIKYIGDNDNSLQSILDVIQHNINNIREYWEKNYDQRLAQVLFNLNIPNLSVTEYYLEEVDYLINKNFVRPEKILFWGTFGKDGKQDLKWVPIENMEIEHLEAVLKTQENMSLKLKNIMKKVLRRKKLNQINLN